MKKKYTLYFNDTMLGQFDTKKECHVYMYYYRDFLKTLTVYEIAYKINDTCYNKNKSIISF